VERLQNELIIDRIHFEFLINAHLEQHVPEDRKALAPGGGLRNFQYGYQGISR